MGLLDHYGPQWVYWVQSSALVFTSWLEYNSLLSSLGVMGEFLESIVTVADDRHRAVKTSSHHPVTTSKYRESQACLSEKSNSISNENVGKRYFWWRSIGYSGTIVVFQYAERVNSLNKFGPGHGDHNSAVWWPMTGHKCVCPRHSVSNKIFFRFKISRLNSNPEWAPIRDWSRVREK